MNRKLTRYHTDPVYRATVLQRSKDWVKANPIKTRKNHREKHRGYRIKVLELFGSKCVRCGMDDIRTLQIDHVFGGGEKDRKTVSNNVYRSVKFWEERLNNHPELYQLLCANCNWIKKWENEESRVLVDK